MTQAVKVIPSLTASKTVHSTTRTGNTGSINFFYVCGSKDKIWIDRAAYSVGDNPTPFRFTGKERDPETGLMYFGARYLDPKTSRWISGDPAMGEYVPLAPLGENERKHNSNLPGMGGVYNLVNLHSYHYSFNNPIRYIDPNGRSGEHEGGWTVSEQLEYLKDYVAKTENMTPQERANDAASLRKEIRESGRYDFDGLITGPDGNEQFMNETLRDFLNTSDTGLPYTIEDMTSANGWSRHYGDSYHQAYRPNGGRNEKYTNVDGREAVFMLDENGKRVLSNHYLDKGTYNYSSKGFLHGSEHGRWDMQPYFRQHSLEGYSRFDYNRNGKTNGTGHVLRR